jgi:site-specific DNA recombinase
MRTASMRDRLLALEARKADLERMAEPERMPRLQPKLAEAYRQQVERLEESLNDPAIRPEAADALRSLIDRIVLYPGERRGEVQADLHGELGAILAFSQGGGSKNRTPEAGVRFSVVAGTRNHLYRTRFLWSRASGRKTPASRQGYLAG